MKVTIVGAGAVGATTADNLIRRNVAEEIVLLDIKEGFAEGKAQDMAQTAALLGFESKIKGVTNDYLSTAGSTVAVITSGIPRKPGMTREELIGTNANIVKSVVENLVKYSPDIIIVIVSNPMDTMTYLALKSSGLPKNRIIGMGGTLDSARFKYQLSEKLNASAADLNAIVIGGHGDTTMIPLIKHSTWNSIPVTDFLTPEEQDEIVHKTMVGGPQPGMLQEPQQPQWSKVSCVIKTSYLLHPFTSKVNLDKKILILAYRLSLIKKDGIGLSPFSWMKRTKKNSVKVQKQCVQ
jgi:malate dehydrogenase